jgi:hypothetical protein
MGIHALVIKPLVMQDLAETIRTVLAAARSTNDPPPPRD